MPVPQFTWSKDHWKNTSIAFHTRPIQESALKLSSTHSRLNSLQNETMDDWFGPTWKTRGLPVFPPPQWNGVSDGIENFTIRSRIWFCIDWNHPRPDQINFKNWQLCFLTSLSPKLHIRRSQELHQSIRNCFLYKMEPCFKQILQLWNLTNSNFNWISSDALIGWMRNWRQKKQHFTRNRTTPSLIGVKRHHLHIRSSELPARVNFRNICMPHTFYRFSFAPFLPPRFSNFGIFGEKIKKVDRAGSGPVWTCRLMFRVHTGASRPSTSRVHRLGFPHHSARGHSYHTRFLGFRPVDWSSCRSLLSTGSWHGQLPRFRLRIGFVSPFISGLRSAAATIRRQGMPIVYTLLPIFPWSAIDYFALHG